ncbi:hypothetical protein AKJ16_DCAP07322 [Drosera capensis]
MMMKKKKSEGEGDPSFSTTVPPKNLAIPCRRGRPRREVGKEVVLDEKEKYGLKLITMSLAQFHDVVSKDVGSSDLNDSLMGEGLVNATNSSTNPKTVTDVEEMQSKGNSPSGSRSLSWAEVVEQRTSGIDGAENGSGSKSAFSMNREQGYPIRTDQLTVSMERRILVDVDVKSLLRRFSLKGQRWSHKEMECKKPIQMKQVWVKKAVDSSFEGHVIANESQVNSNPFKPELMQQNISPLLVPPLSFKENDKVGPVSEGGDCPVEGIDAVLVSGSRFYSLIDAVDAQLEGEDPAYAKEKTLREHLAILQLRVTSFGGSLKLSGIQACWSIMGTEISQAMLEFF